MPKSSKLNNNNLANSELVEIKSKFDAEYRRFSINRELSTKFDDFKRLTNRVHQLDGVEFVIGYIDPQDGDLLPINNDDNFVKALTTAIPLLRLIIQKKGESYGELNGYGSKQKTISTKNPLVKRLIEESAFERGISSPADFRRVSSIIDIDIVPVTQRRVKLMKSVGCDRPLGFYIRDGSGVRCTMSGLVTVDAIFISRLVTGGLAEMTGLLAVNDEVLEVNGIDVCGKTLDQVTDMMVANSNNLIITVKPVNQRNNVSTFVKKPWSNEQQLSSTVHPIDTIPDNDTVTVFDDEEIETDIITTHITEKSKIAL